jgi:serine/threonine protein kinase
MRNICSRCKLTSADGNLWCQELDCPAGALPLLLQYGDYLGNIKVLEQLRVLRSSALYRAERGIGKETEYFFLKVANLGEENERYLKREAEALRTLSAKRAHAEYDPLPVWVHHGAVNGTDAFGIINFSGHNRCFYLMQYEPGEFLADMLLDNPQPWHEHVGWSMIALADAVIAVERATGALHANLNPDVVYVRRNGAGVPLPLLLDMGLLLAPNKFIPASEVENVLRFLQPSYTPPELLGGDVLTGRVDTYGLGLLLFQMLAGRPAFAYTLRRTEDIFTDVRQVKPILTRDDLPTQPAHGKRAADVQSLNEIVQRSVVHDHPKRYTDATEFRNALFVLYGQPDDRREVNADVLFSRIGLYVMVGMIAAFIVFIVVVLLSAVLRPLLV